MSAPPQLLATLARTGEYVRRVQQPGGAIPWFADGILDPWDHVEAAMGLTVAGAHAEAALAYRWLAAQQRADGGWYAAYRDDTPVDTTRAETNFVAYVATGVWHHYRVTGDASFARDLWPCVERAIEFVLTLQAPSGEIYWALDSRFGVNKDALITGCSSICKSLECAIALGAAIGQTRPGWQRARTRLVDAILTQPDRFDRTWPSKSRYSMDWFYPVMTGVIQGEAAVARLDAQWQRFVMPGRGCRCVADQDWVTVAESAELVIALAACGNIERAADVLNWLGQYQAEDGSWWTGFAVHDSVLWPDERPTWTAGAVLLAADALFSLTPAHDLFLTSQGA